MTIKLDFEIHEDPQPVEWIVARIENESITILRKRQEDGSTKYAVYNGSRFVLNREGTRFVYESMPFNREADWCENYRFSTFEEALEKALPAAKKLLVETQERVRRMNERAPR